MMAPMRNVMRRSILSMLGMAALGAGCTVQSATEPSMSDRQDQALKRPFDYSPGDDIPDISGGGVGNFDPKAFGKDLNHVLNP